MQTITKKEFMQCKEVRKYIYKNIGIIQISDKYGQIFYYIENIDYLFFTLSECKTYINGKRLRYLPIKIK